MTTDDDKLRENFAGQNPAPPKEESPPRNDGHFIYPSKPELEDQKNKSNIWVRSLTSLALYFVIGYLFFNKDWRLILVLTIVVVFHEMGHFLAMKYFNYGELGIFFIPLLGAYASGSKQEVSQKQSAIIILAGPVPGILLGILLYIIGINTENFFLEKSAWILFFLNVLNLLPVYPLDGGQLLNRIFLDENKIISNIFILISCAAMAWFVWAIHLYPLLLFPAMILVRMFTEMKHEKLVRKIEAEGVDLNLSYNDISDEQYWKIRNALIKHLPELSDIPPGPPYQYATREDKVIEIMEGLLQRTLIMDLSLTGKLLIMLIWIASFAVPIFLQIPLRIF